MGTWSTTSNVKDKVVKTFITSTEMSEGNKAVDRFLADIGVLEDLVPVSVPDVLVDMAVAYACYRACLYAMVNNEDSYAVKMRQYRDEYEYRRKSTTVEQATGTTTNPTYGSIRIERG